LVDELRGSLIRFYCSTLEILLCCACETAIQFRPSDSDYLGNTVSL